jgi:hypothetical protein
LPSAGLVALAAAELSEPTIVLEPVDAVILIKVRICGVGSGIVFENWKKIVSGT